MLTDIYTYLLTTLELVLIDTSFAKGWVRQVGCYEWAPFVLVVNSTYDQMKLLEKIWYKIVSVSKGI